MISFVSINITNRILACQLYLELSCCLLFCNHYFLLLIIICRAAVVAAAVNRLRMIFDDLLGNMEASISVDESSANVPLTAPPPSPESHSYKKKYSYLSPPKLTTFTSSQSNSSKVCFPFPTVTQDGKFGRVPLRSPLSTHLPWGSQCHDSCNPTVEYF